MIALLSDIHGNLEALEAVLRDSERFGATQLAVLGDTVGYGPNPRQCLERASEVADILLIGNHEHELINPSDDLNDEAKASLDWTLDEVRGSTVWEQLVERVRQHGVASEACKTVDGRLYVHASPTDPVDQYIWPAHQCQYLIFNDQIDERLGEFLAQFSEQHGFFGHTHAPAVLTGYENRDIFDPYRTRGLEWNRLHTFVGPTTLYVVMEGAPRLEGLAEAKVALNPGSVGQPRFIGDADAAYALYDGDQVIFRRVAYDRARTQKKLGHLPLSHETRAWLIERLERGY